MATDLHTRFRPDAQPGGAEGSTQRATLADRMVGAAARGVLASGARSRLLHLGLEHGFASGAVVEHVYRGRAIGSGLLGRRLDARLLNTSAARDLRDRARLLVALIRAWMRETAHLPRRCVLDVAAGSGWLLREAVLGCRPDQLRGVRLVHTEAGAAQIDVRASRVMLEAVGPNDLPSHDVGDPPRAAALDWDAFKEAPAEATPLLRDVRLVVASGLLGLEPDDAAVVTALRRLATASDPDATLLVTHPVRYGGDWEHWATGLLPDPVLTRRVRPSKRRAATPADLPGRRGVGAGRRVVQRSERQMTAMLAAAGWRVDTAYPIGGDAPAWQLDEGGRPRINPHQLERLREPRFLVAACRRTP